MTTDFAQPKGAVNVDDAALAKHLITVIRDHERSRPRSQQRALGPSGVGHPCSRNIAYHLLGYDPVNDGGDKWPAIVGSAAHAWLADCFRAENQRLGHERYLVEETVTAWNGHGGRGSCDLFDTLTGTVLDWKLLGRASMRAQKGEVKDQYRTQAHVYGLGMKNRGQDVQRVALVLLPRSGFLTGLHIWSEPYDPDRALQAKQRVEQLILAANSLDAAGMKPLDAITATPSDECTWCPFWKPGSVDLEQGCPGLGTELDQPRMGAVRAALPAA